MSKNFDLLTQLGERFALLPPPEAPLENLPPAPSHLLGTPIAREKQEATSRGEEIELVQQVFLLPGTDAPKTVVFCGVDEDDVASSLCVSVGESLVAHTSGDVCIVDANLENPFLHKQYGPTDDLGITDLVLASGNGIGKRVARRIGDKPLWLLSAGLRNANGQGMLTLDRLQGQILELREKFSHVLVSAPPAITSREAILFGRFADGVILVLKANSTRRATALKVKQNLEAANVRVLGAVLADRVFPVPEVLYRKL